MPRTASSASYSQAVGRLLRERRGELGESQAEVARRLEVSTTYVQRVEAGHANLTLGQLLRVAEALEAYPRIAFEPLPDTAGALASLDALTGGSSSDDSPD